MENENLNDLEFKALVKWDGDPDTKAFITPENNSEEWLLPTPGLQQ